MDTHHHIVPPFYAQWLEERGITAGGLPIPRWSVDGAVELMEREGLATGIFSISTPGVHLGDDREAAMMARRVNDFAAQVAQDHPGRFGFFSTLTLPDVKGSLSELAYSFDVLKADGVVLLSSVRGEYLGNASQEPLMEELNRRKAVVFVHPGELPRRAGSRNSAARCGFSPRYHPGRHQHREIRVIGAVSRHPVDPVSRWRIPAFCVTAHCAIGFSRRNRRTGVGPSSEVSFRHGVGQQSLCAAEPAGLHRRQPHHVRQRPGPMRRWHGRSPLPSG
ncbi:MAG: hypothetical protein B7Y12_02790 [Rhizobiales bacterium 24-66-13]|nr:MAG: hypothetical protein B7Y61_02335 [Rhizobiales bacterium 35-66-30]OYZ82590.1 MAG: hypothetical protein B7Y12_02790 [Rhizobiales bacterium 24-66-13]OZB11590.1 MAG: hypothetical protein B7X67_03045 [Rhizobiales bacterium 39-66-18]